MEIGLKDNYLQGKVGDYLRNHITPGSYLSFVSAYFTIYAYKHLRTELESIRGMRFLFGEPRFVQLTDPGRIASKHFAVDNSGISLSNSLDQKAVAQECERWIRDKVEIRSLKQSNLLHGKMYLIAGPQDGQTLLFDEYLPTQTALLGSSNFTVRGLGLSTLPGQDNIELNLIVRSTEDFQALVRWFDTIWDDRNLVEDVKSKVLLYLQQLYENQSPQFVYYKTLFHVFERFVTEEASRAHEEETRRLTDTAIWNKLFDFQKDGVKGAINKINRLGGCILADSVGLGKTFEALAVIKYFELKNKNVLVLCPKKLRENWTFYVASHGHSLNPLRADRFGYTVLSHTDLTRTSGKVGDIDLSTFHWDAYDLVVIDESHNFRTESRGKNGNKTRYERLMEDVIKAGGKTKVLLLSATPVNNTLKDLRSQIRLIGEGNSQAFTDQGIANVDSVLSTAQKQFNQWAEKRAANPSFGTDSLLTNLSSSFYTLLDEITIARSRRHIEKYYADVLDKIGKFPEREKPITLTPEIDTEGQFPSYEAINTQITGYQLSLFKPFTYIREEFKAQYETGTIRNFTNAKREDYLIGMMKVNFLKRLESSVFSFGKTLARTVGRIDGLIARLTAFQNAQLDVETIDTVALATETLTEEEEEEAGFDGETLPVGMQSIALKHVDVERWCNDLTQDRERLLDLAKSAQTITPERDAKIAALKGILREKAQQSNRKALIFTAFADTAAYLYDALHTWAKNELTVEVGLIVGSGDNRATFGKSDFTEILTNFSPRSKGRINEKDSREIDFLIATDCISEGQNLQDADMVINYDIHWNPVRLIQRFGRIDRIGSRSATVKMVNFWPTRDLNQYINLKGRVEARMALVDVTATGYDGLLDPKRLEAQAESDIHYRDKQLLRLKDEVLDLEDLSDGVSLTEFTLDDFRVDLIRFLEANRDRLQDAPMGLYACVPVPMTAPPVLQSGVIFCLRQKNFVASKAGEAINPLSPHYLVYIRNDGEVRYNFSQARRILEIFRELCHRQEAAINSLCDLFDRETNDGRDMSRYSILLEKAVKEIQKAYQRHQQVNLFGAANAVIVPAAQNITTMEDFELVTWLVLTREETETKGS